MLQLQCKSSLLATEIVAAAQSQRFEARGHDPGVPGGVRAVQCGLRQRQPKKRGIRLRMVGQQCKDFLGPPPVEQEIRIGYGQEIIVRQEL